MSRTLAGADAAAWERADAATNCGNCLADAAELLPAAEQAPPLEEAVACYRAALSLEEDALVRPTPRRAALADDLLSTHDCARLHACGLEPSLPEQARPESARASARDGE